MISNNNSDYRQFFQNLDKKSASEAYPQTHSTKFYFTEAANSWLSPDLFLRLHGLD
jgi:hypothetical protein